MTRREQLRVSHRLHYTGRSTGTTSVYFLDVLSLIVLFDGGGCDVDLVIRPVLQEVWLLACAKRNRGITSSFKARGA